RLFCDEQRVSCRQQPFLPRLEGLEERWAPAVIVSGQNLYFLEGAATSQVVGNFKEPLTQAAGGYHATIDWGDGITDAGTVTAMTGNLAGYYSVTGSHTYVEEGTFPVSVTVTDAFGTPQLPLQSTPVPNGPTAFVFDPPLITSPPSSG